MSNTMVNGRYGPRVLTPREATVRVVQFYSDRSTHLEHIVAAEDGIPIHPDNVCVEPAPHRYEALLAVDLNTETAAGYCPVCRCMRVFGPLEPTANALQTGE